MKQAVKVAVIGGGSSYTPEIVEGFIQRYGELPVRELWLVDIEQGREKLEIVGQLAKRMIEAAGLPIAVKLTLDRRAAIEGADFVTTQLRVGQLEARAWDERLPLEYGIIGQETTGPGGMMKAFRTIPVILGICRDMEELAPDAWLLNFTNPAGMVTEAVLKYAKIRSIGLCNAPIGFRKQMAGVFGVPVHDVVPEFAGINHLHWVTSLHIRGENKLDELLSGRTAVNPSANVPGLSWPAEWMQALGAIPSYYLRYYYLRDEMLKEQLAAAARGETRAETVRKVERELFDLYRDPELKAKPRQLELRGGAYYSEAAVDLMQSLHNDRRDIQTLNVANGNNIDFLPADASIEVNCVVTANGPIPLQVSKVPRAAAGLLQTVKAYEALAVDAAVQGDRQLALQAIASHPLSPSVAAASKLLHAMLERNKRYLPQFYSHAVK